MLPQHAQLSMTLAIARGRFGNPGHEEKLPCARGPHCVALRNSRDIWSVNRKGKDVWLLANCRKSLEKPQAEATSIV